MTKIFLLALMAVVVARATTIEPGRVASDWPSLNNQIELAPGERLTLYAFERYTLESSACPQCPPVPNRVTVWTSSVADVRGLTIELYLLAWHGELYTGLAAPLEPATIDAGGNVIPAAQALVPDVPLDYQALFPPTNGRNFRVDVVNIAPVPVPIIGFGASFVGAASGITLGVGANPAPPYTPAVPEPGSLFLFVTGSALLLWRTRNRLAVGPRRAVEGLDPVIDHPAGHRRNRDRTS